jgi:phosphohistidine phosphatase
VDLYVVRHAIAESREDARFPEDRLRPLSPVGVDTFRRAARGIRRLGLAVDRVLASPYLRATQTAELLTEEAGWPKAEPCSELEPARPPGLLLGVLAAQAGESLAVVGHEPELSRLVSLLIAADSNAAAIDLKKGGVACVRISGSPAAGRGSLRWAVSPKILRALGG